MDDLLTLADAKEKFRQILNGWQIQQEELLQKAFHFAQAELIVSYEQLSNYLTSKQSFITTNVSKVAVVPIGEFYLVKAISSQSERADLQQLEQILRFVMSHRNWQLCINCIHVYKFYIVFVQQLYSKKEALQLIHDVTRKVMKLNTKSLQLKEMHLHYIVYLFSIESVSVQREMKTFDRRWSTGKWVLNKKEQVLLQYARMHLAARRKRWQAVKYYAELLLKDDLLPSYAVELTIDFGRLLPSFGTDANVFIKPFKHHYVAYTCFLYVMALDALHDDEGIVRFIKTEPIASCMMLYTYFQTRNPDNLVRVETVVQQNIGVLVDGHHGAVRASIERWQQRLSESNELILTLSEHVCRLIKACFMTGELAVFEKLMTIYMKYLYVERHFIRLKESLKSNIESANLVQAK